jgi:hypothetical protein
MMRLTPELFVVEVNGVETSPSDEDPTMPEGQLVIGRLFEKQDDWQDAP